MHEAEKLISYEKGAIPQRWQCRFIHSNACKITDICDTKWSRAPHQESSTYDGSPRIALVVNYKIKHKTAVKIWLKHLIQILLFGLTAYKPTVSFNFSRKYLRFHECDMSSSVEMNCVKSCSWHVFGVFTHLNKTWCNAQASGMETSVLIQIR